MSSSGAQVVGFGAREGFIQSQSSSAVKLPAPASIDSYKLRKADSNQGYTNPKTSMTAASIVNFVKIPSPLQIMHALTMFPQ